ncbi:hypothetical protein XELAEV_18041707mg [Xenopus laevis]|uniref:Uncharacterized protein n=1 Tax=Xenopus laevis TaxID=8355 RepID=A0A974C3A1_XENLA|nr:hypothetical protein XELAEV_18041707mg [Xenopus laevis]
MRIIAQLCVGSLLLCVVLWLCWIKVNTKEKADEQPRSLPQILTLPGYSCLPDVQMLGSGLGPQIDQAECVLRMNTAPTLGYEMDVGSWSSLRVVSQTSFPFLLCNQTYFFQQSQDTVYVIWGPLRQMDIDSGITAMSGTFTMILAMELCEEITVYGMRSVLPPPVPYHYYEKGRLDECTMYMMHERASMGAHRFITEKAVFSRWARRKRIHLAHPSWDA